MTTPSYKSDVVIAGGGLAGIVAALELLDRGKRVLLIDKDVRANFGGLAKESLGGIHLMGTPHKKRMGISDSQEIALKDWERCAEFGEHDDWPRRWAKVYCEQSIDIIYQYLTRHHITFLPLVN